MLSNIYVHRIRKGRWDHLNPVEKDGGGRREALNRFCRGERWNQEADR